MVDITKRALSPFKVALRAVALTFVICATSGAWAEMEFTDPTYTPWDGVYGAVAWRSDGGNFEVSKVADIAADGTIGEPYAMKWDTAVATSGRRFCSACHSSSWYPGYTPPGMLLVYDQTGKTAAANATFNPLSFCGLWVKALANETTPYSVTGSSSNNRATEFGVAGVSSYFKFDKSFTVNRTGTTTFLGDATVEIAQDATFTAQANASYGVAVNAGATLKLKGAGTLAVTTMTVNGTLDLSAATVPTISGNVTLAGTIVLPEGTEVSAELPFTVCTGTLSGLNVFVKIGDAEAVEKSFTAENGAITSFGEPIYEFTGNFPTTIPSGVTYTFIGGATAETAVTVPSMVTVSGTLKTSGFITVPYFAGTNAAKLDVIDGTTTLICGNYKDLAGDVVVEAGATLVNGNTDAVDWNDRFIANVYGTLDMGATRWSLGSNNTINFHEGCTVTGTGQQSNGTFDWIENANATLNVYGDVNLAAPIRIRSTATVNVNVDTTDQKGLTLAGTIGAGKIVKKGAGLVKFTTNPPYAITVENGAFTFAVDATPTITYSAKPGSGTSMSMWYATQATWKGTVVLGVLSDPTALPLNTYGNANSKIVLKGTTGSCYLSAGTINPELVIDTDEDDVVEFNNGSSGQVVNFTKISGSGTLKLTGWIGCSSATYNLNTIDGFTGTLAIHNAITRNGGGTFTIGIGNIVTTGATTPGSNVLNLTQTAVEGATGTVVYNTENAQVNGEPAKLAVTANGVYVAGGAATIGGNTTYYRGSSSAYIAVLGGGSAGDSFTVFDDADYGELAGFTYNSETKTYTMLQMVAQFTYGVQTTKFATLAAACTAAEAFNPVPTVELLVALGEQSVPSGWRYSNPEASGTTYGTLTKLVTATVPAVANTTVTVKIGEETIGNAAGNYDVAPGSVVTVTYAVNDAYEHTSGELVYNIDTASETTCVPDIVTTQYVARNNNVKFTTVADAIANAKTSQNPMVSLLADISDEDIVVDAFIMLIGNFTVSSSVTVSDGGLLQVTGPTLDCTLTIGEKGAYATNGGTLKELVTKNGATIQLTALSETVPPLAVTTLSVEGNLTIISSWGSAVRDTYYKAISYVTENADIAEGATVDSVNEWSAKVEEEGDNTVVYLAITKVAVVDGVYYDTAQDAVDAAVSSGEPVSFLVTPGTVTLGAGETLVVKGATLPTVVLDDGLAAPYEVEHTVDTVNVLNIYTVVKYVAKVKNPVYGTTAWQPEVKYTSLADAVADVIENTQSGYVAGYVPIITLLDDVTLDAPVTVGKRMNLDLNGHAITASGVNAITTSGALTIQGSSGSISVTSGASVMLTDRAATLTVSGVTLSPAPTTSVEGAKVKLIDGVYKVVYGTIFSIY